MKWRDVGMGGLAVVAIGALVSLGVIGSMVVLATPAIRAGDVPPFDRSVMRWSAVGEPIVLATLTVAAVLWVARRVPSRMVEHAVAVGVVAALGKYLVSTAVIGWSIWLANHGQKGRPLPISGMWLWPSAMDVLAGPVVAALAGASVVWVHHQAEGRRPTRR